MNKKFYLALMVIGISICLFLIFGRKSEGDRELSLNTEIVSDSSLFDLRKGDILVRPNSGWLPGSCKIKGGRRYGHVAVVVEGASGSSVSEILGKAKVVEALFFDQATRKFQFNRKKQIRETQAIVSFGERFKGIRYRLRMDLSNSQADSIIWFLRNQLDMGYNILSFKRKPALEKDKKIAFEVRREHNWHCATLVWEAFYLVPGVDIDANKGLLIYPSDIIASRYFEKPGGRICF